MSSLVKRLLIDAHECEEQHGPVRWSEDLKEAADRIRDLEHALEFIRKKASSPKIWYAGVAQAALDGEVKAPEKKDIVKQKGENNAKPD